MNGGSLIDKIGGVEAASGVLIPAVELLCQKMLNDQLLAPYFQNTDMARLQSKQVEFLAYVFGGPDRYAGKDLFEAHEDLIRNHGLNETHFDAVLGHFKSTLQELGAAEDLVKDACDTLGTARSVFARGHRAGSASGISTSSTDQQNPALVGRTTSGEVISASRSREGSYRGGIRMGSRQGSAVDLPIDDMTAVALHLQSMLDAQDAELATARNKLKQMMSGKDGPEVERAKAALRMRGSGLAELLDEVVGGR